MPDNDVTLNLAMILGSAVAGLIKVGLTPEEIHKHVDQAIRVYEASKAALDA